MTDAPPSTPITGVQLQQVNPDSIRIRLQSPAIRPTIGQKGPTPPPVVLARKALPEYEVPSPCSDESCSDSDESSSSAEEKKKKKKKKRRSKRSRSSSRSRSRSPAKKSRRVDPDSDLVAPLPFMQFLLDRQTPKACGRCLECRKAPCTVCASCVQNAKILESPDTIGQRKKDLRRCEALRCVKDKVKGNDVLPQGVPLTKDAIAREKEQICSELADLSVMRSRPDFDEVRYQQLVDRRDELITALGIVKKRRARRVATFPRGFHNVWGYLSAFEQQRLKNSKFVVRSGNSKECYTIDLARRLRDDAIRDQIRYGVEYAEYLCPDGEKEEFMRVLEASKGYTP